MSAAKFTFLCILAGSILHCGIPHAVGNSLSNVCDYAHLSDCIRDGLVRIRNHKSVEEHTLPILNVMALEAETNDYPKRPKGNEGKVDTHPLQPDDESHTLCKWHYELDEDHLRIPVYVVKAIPDDAMHDSQQDHHFSNGKQCQCSPVSVDLPVTLFHTCSSGKEEWAIEKMSVNAGYTCKRITS